MFCGECGTQNPDTNQFCKNCGKPLAKRQPAGGPPAPAAPPAAPPTPVVQPVPAPAAPRFPPAAAPAPAVAPAVNKQRNWLGIVSMIFGVISLGLLPVIFALIAIVLGAASLIIYRNASGRIGITSVIGMVLGIVSIILVIAL